MKAKSPQLPTAEQIKKPLLALLKKRKGEVSLTQAIDHIARTFDLPEKMTEVKQKCGKETTLQNRLRWARWQLKREGVIETTRRGYFKLIAQ